MNHKEKRFLIPAYGDDSEEASIEFKSCPFCRSKCTIRKPQYLPTMEDNFHYPDDILIIGCSNDICPIHPKMKFADIGNGKAKAIAAWNTQASVPDQPVERTYPQLLSEDEKKGLLEKAENLWSALEANNLGGLSGINRPFLILNEFREAIEQFGNRDTGLTWSINDLRKAKAPKREIVDPDLLTIVRMIAADDKAKFQQEAKNLLSKIEDGE